MTPTVAHLNGQLAGRYQIEREIGAGGMATVYLARDLRHERRVALKVLKPELGAVLGVERFLSEIRVTANLQHPNLLPLFDSGEADGLLYYVMPFVEGESLRARLDRERQLPVDEAVRIAVAVASALDYAHAQGVIHRDLKPENILLQSGQPVVADFGIALAVANAGGARVTQTGLSLGTPHYMSPEQATGDRIIDGRSDIYSLAAVTYELLTGEPPHTGSTAQAIIARVLTEQPRSLRATRPTLPEHVDLAVTRALAKLPADRWTTAGQFSDALQGRLTIDRPTDATRPAPLQRGWRDRAKDPVVWVALAVAAAGVTFGALSLPGRSADEEGSAVYFELTFGEGEPLAPVAQLAIAPDGKSIVYEGLRQAAERILFFRELNQGMARALPGSEGGTQPFFSPDGEWVGFIVQGEVKKVNIATGTVLTLARLPGLPQGAGWASDDRIVTSVGQRLMIIPADGGEPEPLTALDSLSGETNQRGPRVLADGETVLFASGRPNANETRIGIASVTTGRTDYLNIPDATPVGMVDGHLIYATSAGLLMAVPFDVADRRVTGSPVNVGDGILVTTLGTPRAWVSASGSLLYRSGSATGQVVVTEPDGEVRPLITEPKSYVYPRLSPDGNRLALTIQSGINQEVWIHDIASNTTTRFSSEGTLNSMPEWTPDGRRVLYVSNRGGSNALWWQNADFSGRAEVLQAFEGGRVEEGVISPDAQYLAFRTNDRQSGQNIWYRRLQGDTTAQPIANGPPTEMGPRFSTDGKWIAYGAEQDGMRQVYVQPFPPTGARYQVSSGGGSAPLWSKDGGRIYYILGPQLRVAHVVTTPTFAVTARDTLFRSPYINLPPHASYDVTADGGLVYSRSLSQDAPTIMVHDWKYELRRRMAGGG